MNKAVMKKHEHARLRARRTRGKIRSVAVLPRLSVFRSAKHISVQVIDDTAGKTLASSSDKHIDAAGKKPVEIAALVGADIAKKAVAANVKQVVFDRGSYKFHGRVKALADAAREGGLEF